MLLLITVCFCITPRTNRIVGHDQLPERPLCSQPKTGGGVQWTDTSRAKLDRTDRLNSIDDGPGIYIDRHSCTSFDVNMDGKKDIICLVGANKAVGVGYNELYLTRDDGSLHKVLKHGLQKYRTLSTKLIAKLKSAATGAHLVFIGVANKKRPDKRVNSNRMFRHLKTGKAPYFVEHFGPWVKYNDVTAITVARINADAYDDFITCGDQSKPRMYVQNRYGRFNEIRIPTNKYIGSKGWRDVLVGRVTRNQRPDLITIEGSYKDPSYLRIYKGIRKRPFFDFSKPYYSKRMPNAASGLEILDVNQDGWKDIYVTQANEERGYCAGKYYLTVSSLRSCKKPLTKKKDAHS